MNKNDLRYLKTEKLIESTYYELRMKHGGPVKVSELCEAAMINKTTFYLHYETMNDLHEHMCNKLIKDILDSCPNVDKAYTDLDNCMDSVLNTLLDKMDTILKFFGDNVPSLINSVEIYFLKLYITDDVPIHRQAEICFAIGGAARLLASTDNPAAKKVTADLIKRIFT